MSTDRIAKGAGWAHQPALPKGPNGRALCRRCGEEVPKGRQTFCGASCVDEWKVRTQPAFARRLVERRDHGICAICRRDTAEWGRLRAEWQAASEREISRLHRQSWNEAFSRPPEDRDAIDRELYAATDLVRKRWRALGFGVSARHTWEMDHTVPVVEGGGSCGLDNLRTLCRPCHRRVTREQAGRRAKGRRP